MSKAENDSINPSHYKQGKIEIIDFIEDQNFNFRLGNAIKYICRCRYKGTHIDDLKKAIWYLEREIKQLLTPIVPETRMVPKLNLSTSFEIEPGKVITLEKPISFPPNEQLELPLEFKDHTKERCNFGGCYRCQTVKEIFDAPKT